MRRLFGIPKQTLEELEKTQCSEKRRLQRSTEVMKVGTAFLKLDSSKIEDCDSEPSVFSKMAEQVPRKGL